ncbi:HTH-type transcriptional regulator MalT [Burkholderiales bacterium]|nr:MAG: hypothetical protein F9K47_01000 [Burkholderiales bacterium]CAG1010393.1 HTH-type transcriptional regulator MalT [Burkholderiales bacterium]
MEALAQRSGPRLSFAKLTAPRPERIIARERLFRSLDEAPAIVWIAAPAGAGKSTLAASWLTARGIDSLWYRLDSGDVDPAAVFAYIANAATGFAATGSARLPALTPEYFLGLDIYARNFFRRLCAEFAPLSCLVLDDYHELPEQAQLHSLLRHGLEEIPSGFRVVVISRGEPPAEYARLRLNGRMVVLGWQDLRLTAEEAGAVVELRASGLAHEVVRDLYRHAEGWVAGLILMLEQGTPRGFSPDAPLVFDYFAAEVLAHLDEATRRFLAATSLLPTVRASSAAALTGAGDASDLLAGLARRGFFVTRCGEVSEDRYEYHPLLRRFLLASGQGVLGSEAWGRRKSQAAQLLAAEGESEAAIKLFGEVGDWPEMAKAAAAAAPALLAQGRHRTLRLWIESLPAALFDQSPWLEYFAGHCDLPISPARARQHFERAYAGFAMADEVLGQYSSWAYIGTCFTQEYYHLAEADRWIAELARLRERHPVVPPQVEVQVLSAAVGLIPLRQPNYLGLDEMATRLESLAAQCGNVSIRLFAAAQLLAFYSFYRGNLAAAHDVTLRFEPDADARESAPLALQFWDVWRMYYGRSSGDLELYREALARAQATAQASGVLCWALHHRLNAIWDFAYGQAWDEAGRLLDECGALAQARPYDVQMYYFYGLLFADASGDLPRFRHAAREFRRVAEQSGTLTAEAYVALLSVLECHAAGEIESIWPALERAKVAAQRCGAITPHIDVAFTGADLARRLGDAPRLNALMRDFFELGARHGRVGGYFLAWRQGGLAELCVLALEEAIEPEFVRQLVRLLRLVPESSPSHLDDWPWPVRVHSFGGFEIFIDDQPLAFSANRVPVKPIELLKALIALGGSEVAQEKLADMLWPESDGDAARRAFYTNLDRLRGLIGKETLTMRQGKLSLDPRRVWTDLAALDGAAARLRSSPPLEAGTLAEFADQALARFTGTFLPHEEALPWLPDARRGINKRRAAFFKELIRHCELAGDPVRVARCRDAVAG